MRNLDIGLIIILTAGLSSCSKPQHKMNDADKNLYNSAIESFKPLPLNLIDKTEKQELISLGEKLYFEKKLSVNNTISCNSCHLLDKFGVDNQATSPGHNKKRGNRNSPTTYNAAINFVQFWDGRAENLEAQAVGPILNPIEHGYKDAESVIKAIDTAEYQAHFARAFNNKSGSLNLPNIGVAIAAFEKTLLTPSRFDDYLRGDANAITQQEKVGLKKFMEFGCTACHDGAGVGGGMFQKVGLVNEYDTKDQGRFEVTKNADDRKFFKVPSLRNIHHTAPYFHDGKVKTLEDAIRKMAFHQLGQDLSKEDVNDIKIFLGSLSGKPETFYKTAKK